MIDFLIAFYVPLYLRNPELSAGFDVVLTVLPVIPVPELTVAEHGDLLPDECNVWFSRDVLDILAVTKAAGPEFFPEFHLYFGVLTADTGHIVVDLFGRFYHCNAFIIVYCIPSSEMGNIEFETQTLFEKRVMNIFSVKKLITFLNPSLSLGIVIMSSSNWTGR